MKPFRAPSPETVAWIRELAERPLAPEQFEADVRAPLSQYERDETFHLIDWFVRRYPTGRERLAYARRAYARWARAMPPSTK